MVTREVSEVKKGSEAMDYFGALSRDYFDFEASTSRKETRT
jgi:penicillin-binding protein-related factor A (putative recombinase)